MKGFFAALFVMIFSLGTAQIVGLPPGVLNEHRAFVDATVQGKVHGRGLGELSWKLVFRTADHFLLNVHSEDSSRTAYVEGDRLIVYDPRLNQYLQKRVTGRMIDAIRATLGGVDPALEIFVDPATGLLSFLNGFGSLEFHLDGSEYVASPGEGYKVRVGVDPSMRLVTSLIAEDPTGVVAQWTFRITKGLRTGEPTYTVPEGAVRVEAFSDVGKPPVYDERSRQIISDSSQKYRQLTTLMYSVRAYSFGDGSQSTMQLNGWWERDGRMRFGLTMNNPDVSFAVLYEKDILTGWDRKKGILLRSVVPRNDVLSKLLGVGIVREPLMRSLLGGTQPWDALAGPGATVRYRDEDAVFGGEKQHVLDVEQADGWRAVVYVRANDLLISRIERTRRDNGRVVFAETAIYDYSIVNAPIPSSAWSLGQPSNISVEGWPSG